MRAPRVLPGLASLIGLALLVGGCGFTPLYGTHDLTDSPVNSALAAINVMLIPERNGQILREALQQHFAQGGGLVAPRYDLTVSWAINADNVATVPENAVSLRVRLSGAATWTLRSEDAAQATMASGTAWITDGYNNIDSQPFTGQMENQSVQTRMTHAVADQITEQIAAYFNRHLAKPG